MSLSQEQNNFVTASLNLFSSFNLGMHTGVINSEASTKVSEKVRPLFKNDELHLMACDGMSNTGLVTVLPINNDAEVFSRLIEGHTRHGITYGKGLVVRDYFVRPMSEFTQLVSDWFDKTYKIDFLASCDPRRSAMLYGMTMAVKNFIEAIRRISDDIEPEISSALAIGKTPANVGVSFYVRAKYAGITMVMEYSFDDLLAGSVPSHTEANVVTAATKAHNAIRGFLAAVDIATLPHYSELNKTTQELNCVIMRRLLRDKNPSAKKVHADFKDAGATPTAWDDLTMFEQLAYEVFLKTALGSLKMDGVL